MTGLLEITN